MRTKEQSEKVAHSCREILALCERWGNPDPEYVRVITEKLHEAEQEIKQGGKNENSH
jgi:hypothetical protein